MREYCLSESLAIIYIHTVNSFKIFSVKTRNFRHRLGMPVIFTYSLCKQFM